MLGKVIDSIGREELPHDLDISTMESAVVGVIGDHALDTARDAHIAVLLRMLEVSLTSHPMMLSMIRTPNVYLGREEAEIRKIFETYGIAEPASELVKFFVRIVRGRVAQNPTKTRIDTKLFGRVLRNSYQSEDEFRCRDCGYHFLESDMSPYKGDQATEYGVIFGQETPSQRFRDPWKPTRQEYRYPTVDHVQPEAALGPTLVENLRIICGFCNSRKKIDRRPIESFGPRVNSALMAVLGGPRGQWATESAVYFAICQEKHCSACGNSNRQSELTAVPVVNDYKWTGLLPWQLRVVCYDDSGL